MGAVDDEPPVVLAATLEEVPRDTYCWEYLLGF
jgi:hypothetical protein